MYTFFEVYFFYRHLCPVFYLFLSFTDLLGLFFFRIMSINPNIYIERIFH